MQCVWRAVLGLLLVHLLHHLVESITASRQRFGEDDDSRMAMTLSEEHHHDDDSRMSMAVSEEHRHDNESRMSMAVSEEHHHDNDSRMSMAVSDSLQQQLGDDQLLDHQSNPDDADVWTTTTTLFPAPRNHHPLDDDLVLPAPSWRRQNDRMEPLPGGVAPSMANFPTVYRRLLMKRFDAAATRRWISTARPDRTTPPGPLGVKGADLLNALGPLAVKGTDLLTPLGPLALGLKHPGLAIPLGSLGGPGPLTIPDQLVAELTSAPSESTTAGSRIVFPTMAPALGAPAQSHRSKQAKLREKIAKFLNLFTVVQFPNDACEAPAVGLTGTCYHHLQCRSLGGHPGGACAQGYGVCCLFEKTCGGTTRYNSTYFVSSPTAEDDRPVDGYFTCFLTVEKLHADVNQLRLDFLHFELAGPTDGTCLEERFIVVSPDRNAPTPALCGTNTGQHMYVQVGSAGGSVRVAVQWRAPSSSSSSSSSSGSPTRRWVVRLTQLRARDEGAAPPGCLQFHTGHAGQVQSFGYQGPAPGSYTNNLNYAICIRKDAGFCSVTYSTVSLNGTTMPFQLLNEDQDGRPTIPPGQAGAEVLNCPNDYIVINGIRLCGERLNDASVDPDYTHSSPVTDNGGGPFVLPVRTNGNLTGRGFSLSYRLIACSDARVAF